MVRLAIATAIFVSICLSCVGESDVVRMGTEEAYPPYTFINDADEVDGFERELGDELCRRADLECTWVTNEWYTIMAGMSITAERDEVIDFTQPYFPPIPSVYIALAGAGDEAVDGTVAAQVATIHADHLSESAATLIEYDLVENLIEAVLSGETDAALVDHGFAHESMAANAGKLAVVGPTCHSIPASASCRTTES